MSIEYEIYARSVQPIAVGELTALCRKSPPLVYFDDGPFFVRVLRGAKWDLSEFSIVDDGPVLDGDIVAGCMETEASEMNALLRNPSEEAMHHFFGLSGCGLAPIAIESNFSFASYYEGEEASEILGDDDEPALNALEQATLMYSVRASGEGWFQVILCHVIAYRLGGLFYDPQSGDFRLYQ